MDNQFVIHIIIIILLVYLIYITTCEPQLPQFDQQFQPSFGQTGYIQQHVRINSNKDKMLNSIFGTTDNNLERGNNMF